MAEYWWLGQCPEFLKRKHEGVKETFPVQGVTVHKYSLSSCPDPAPGHLPEVCQDCSSDGGSLPEDWGQDPLCGGTLQVEHREEHIQKSVISCSWGKVCEKNCIPVRFLGGRTGLGKDGSTPGWTASTTTQQLGFSGNKCLEKRSIWSTKTSGVAPLIADPPPAYSTFNMHGRLVCQDRNIWLGMAVQAICPFRQNHHNCWTNGSN